MGKKSLVIGAAIGYVLGARAGRKRYDQIVSSVSRLWNDPKVQSRVDQAQTAAVDTAKSAAATAKDAVVNNPTVQNTVQAAKDKLPGSGSGSSSSTGSPSTASTGTTQPGSRTPSTPLPTTPPLNTPGSASTTPRP